MGLITDALRTFPAAMRTFAPRDQAPLSTAAVSYGANSLPSMSGNYLSYARDGYAKNEIIYSAIELRATSAAEPHVIGRRTVKDNKRRDFRQALLNNGATDLQAAYYANQLQEDITDHPAIRVLNRPNPFMSRFRYWSTVIMHRDLAGNAYAWKARNERDEVVELWPLRPDRVRVIPGNSTANFVRGYKYTIGQESVEIPARDIIHYRTRHPYDDYYGLPPLMPVSGRVDIDNYMREFVGAFFRNGGNPGAILAVKTKLNQETKDEIRKRYRSQFGGPGGAFELMVLDSAEASFTPMTMQLGQRGLVVPELNAISEARLSMVFGVPLSILGALTGQESSSYANKRSDWQVLWDITLTPLYVDLGDTLNLSYQPDFPDIDEFLFDLTDVKALQEDVDKLHDRLRKDLQAGALTVEEYRMLTGRNPDAEGVFLIPGNYVQVPAGDLGKMPDPVEQPALAARWLMAALSPRPAPVMLEAPKEPEVVAEARCPTCNSVGGRDVHLGAYCYCRKCKAEFKAGEGMVVEQKARRVIDRDAAGAIVGYHDEVY